MPTEMLQETYHNLFKDLDLRYFMSLSPIQSFFFRLIYILLNFEYACISQDHLRDKLVRTTKSDVDI